MKICGNVEVKGTNSGYSPVSVTTDGDLMIFTGFVNDEADLFMYDVDSETLTNITETDNIKESNPRFSTDNESACFITAIDSVHQLCVLDVQTLSIYILYSTDLRIPGCIYSVDNERIYFVEETDSLNKSTLDVRDSYQGNVISLNIITSEITVLDANSGSWGAHNMQLNQNYILYGRIPSAKWIAYRFDSQIMTMLDQSGVDYVDINESDQILHSSDSVTGSIRLFNIEMGTFDEIITDSFGGSYNLDETKICFVSRYKVNKGNRLTD
ncbi:MAG: hypothetical protein JXL67_06240 [Calditrichaeota bacterium]|nr:hypothetical protein [Calditrichota bacterium]